MRNTNVVNIKPVYESDLESQVEMARVIDREIKRLTKILDTQKKAIIELMGDKSAVHNALGGVIATLSVVTTNSFDKDRFNTDYPGVYDFYTKQTATKRFSFK
jgi:predicted phage-related endonuclease